MASAIVVAGLLDAVENWAMLQYLESADRGWAPPLAGAAASLKWVLSFVVIGFILWRTVSLLLGRPRGIG